MSAGLNDEQWLEILRKELEELKRHPSRRSLVAPPEKWVSSGEGGLRVAPYPGHGWRPMLVRGTGAMGLHHLFVACCLTSARELMSWHLVDQIPFRDWTRDERRRSVRTMLAAAIWNRQREKLQNAHLRSVPYLAGHESVLETYLGPEDTETLLDGAGIAWESGPDVLGELGPHLAGSGAGEAMLWPHWRRPWAPRAADGPTSAVAHLQYGEVLASASKVGADEVIAFQGAERDGESGFTNFGHRVLMGVGVFATPDPAGPVGGNPYGFVSGRMTTHVEMAGAEERFAQGNSVGALIEKMGEKSRNNPVENAFWGVVHTGWSLFGAEGVSRMADGSADTGDLLGAGFEVVGILPGGKIAAKVGGKVIALARSQVKPHLRKMASRLGRYAGAPCKISFVEGTLVSGIRHGIEISSIRPGDVVVAAGVEDLADPENLGSIVVDASLALFSPDEPKTSTLDAIADAQLPLKCPPRTAMEAPDLESMRVHRFDPVRAVWEEAWSDEVAVGDDVVFAGMLYHLGPRGFECRGAAAVSDLLAASEVYSPAAAATRRAPTPGEWVLVLGPGRDAGHWELRQAVTRGDWIAFEGRVFEVLRNDSTTSAWLVPSDKVLARVAASFDRVADRAITASLAYADGARGTLTGTPEHPFYVPEDATWVELDDLQVGTELLDEQGERTVLVGKGTLRGPISVYNLEVASHHNYFVRDGEGGTVGVLVRNCTRVTAGKNFKGHFDRARSYTQKALGVKIGKLKEGGGDELLGAIAQGIDDGVFESVGKGTLKKGGEVMNIYRGEGYTVVTKESGEFVTMLKSGQGLDDAIQMLP